MAGARTGQVAVIFVSQRSEADPAGYAAAAAKIKALAAAQPGYRGHHGVRDAGGTGITVSYWADDATARAWRDHPEHRAIRRAGRDRWYDAHEVVVAHVERDYAWRRPGGDPA